MSAQVQNFLSSFDHLPEPTKIQVSIEILRRFVAGLTADTAGLLLQQPLLFQATYPLRGEPVRIEDPFSFSVPPEDWSSIS
jgi:hypothetical protein